jgi:Concanavalin A-like lectin/glucanases superfamily/The GLUG motif
MKKYFILILLIISIGLFAYGDYRGTCVDINGTSEYGVADEQVIPGSGNFTVAVWAKADPGLTGFHEILSQDGTWGRNFYIGSAWDGWEFKIRVGDDWQTTGASFPTDDQWHYYTVTRSATNTILYLDGVQVGVRGSAMLNPNGNEFRIGRQYGGYGEYFPGQIDELRIWNYAQTPTQINDTMNITLNATGLIHYYQFNYLYTNDLILDSASYADITLIGGQLTQSTIPWNVSSPTVTTDSVDNITQNTASSGGIVTNNGLDEVSARGVCWNTSPNPTTANSHTTNGTGIGTFYSPINNLTGNTVYHVRAYATNYTGTGYGANHTFTTLPVIPSVTTTTATSISHLDAVSGGNVVNDGGAAVTTHGVCWSTNSNPNVADDHTVDGSGIGGYTSEISNLTPLTEYFYRAYATNSIGTAYGAILSFSTLPPLAPTVSTTIATSITHNTVTTGGDITDDGGSELTVGGVCWSTNPNPTVSDSFSTDGSGEGVFISNIDGISAATTYHYRAYATNSTFTIYGDEFSFTTLNSIVPTVITTTVTLIEQHTASSGGEVTDNGGITVSNKGVCWSTIANPTTADSHTTDGSGTGSFISYVTGLTASTEYHFRAYATNSVGTSYGNEYTFTTLDLMIPVISTTTVTAITETTAMSGGNVTYEGGEPVTTRGVCWSTSVNPTISDNHSIDGVGTGTFTSTIVELAGVTNYYYRAYATNSVGTGYGTEMNFTTTCGGLGTDVDPYRISNLAELRWLSEHSYFWGTQTGRFYFIQTADIDAADTRNWNNGEGFSPIGELDQHFYGSYDGQGFVIDGLYINRPTETYLGLFGLVSGSSIINVGVTNVDVSGNNCVGGFAGRVYSSGSEDVITNCYSTGSVIGNYLVGGMFGSIHFNESITNCYNASTVEGDSLTGGLAGLSYFSTINNCYNTGNVTGVYDTGGLVGRIDSANSITNCYNTGSVIGTDYNFAGGLVGYSWMNNTISNCYNTGTVSGCNIGGLVGRNDESVINECCNIGSVNDGATFAGGLVGVNLYSSLISNCFSSGSVNGGSWSGGLVGTNQSSSEIINCYSSGSVSGNIYIGGIAGSIDTNATITNCYSTSHVTGTAQKGGLVGNLYSATVSNSFWDIETSGLATSYGGTGKTTVEMQNMATFTDLTSVGLTTAWDFVGTPYDDLGTEDLWNIDNQGFNDGYPFLNWQEIPSVPPAIPQNIEITIIDGSILITWDEAENAISYIVYSSSNPEEGFEPDYSGSFGGRSWFAPLSNSKKYYYVKAVN